MVSWGYHRFYSTPFCSVSLIRSLSSSIQFVYDENLNNTSQIHVHDLDFVFVPNQPPYRVVEVPSTSPSSTTYPSTLTSLYSFVVPPNEVDSIVILRWPQFSPSIASSLHNRAPSHDYYEYLRSHPCFSSTLPIIVFSLETSSCSGTRELLHEYVSTPPPTLYFFAVVRFSLNSSLYDPFSPYFSSNY